MLFISAGKKNFLRTFPAMKALSGAGSSVSTALMVQRVYDYLVRNSYHVGVPGQKELLYRHLMNSETYEMHKSTEETLFGKPGACTISAAPRWCIRSRKYKIVIALKARRLYQRNEGDRSTSSENNSFAQLSSVTCQRCFPIRAYWFCFGGAGSPSEVPDTAKLLPK